MVFDNSFQASLHVLLGIIDWLENNEMVSGNNFQAWLHVFLGLQSTFRLLFRQGKKFKVGYVYYLHPCTFKLVSSYNMHF